MPSSHTEIETNQAQRYMDRVSKHWSHRFSVSYESEHQSTIDFGNSSCKMESREQALLVEVTGPDASLSMLEDTVLEHLQRFAPKDHVLKAQWRRAA